MLRRKAPSIEQRKGYARTESSASSHEPTPPRQPLGMANSPGGFSDPFPDSILGITAPPIPSTIASRTPGGLGAGFEYATSSSRMANYNSRRTPPVPSPQVLPPPTPTLAHDSGSSTRRSESPGAFSQTSTPTSMSSQSPGISMPVQAPARTRRESPVGSRPPITISRRRLPMQEDIPASSSRGLTSVRESATSSSSSSTVKGTGPRDTQPKPSKISAERSSSHDSNPPSRTGPGKQISSSRALPLPRQEVAKTGLSQPRVANRFVDPAIDQRMRQNNTSQGNRSKIPPPRPSREGAPELPAEFHSAVVRTESEARRPHPGSTISGRSPSSASSTSALPSRLPSPNPSSVQLPRPTLASASRSRASPSVETNVGSIGASKDPSPQSAGSSKSTSRFGLFTRRTKSPLESTAVENIDRSLKKGPAAGTGHEGYKNYARRGRSGSISTSASRGRSTSSTSVGQTSTSRKSSLTSRDGPESKPELDEFYRSRLEPNSIRGGLPTDDLAGKPDLQTQESVQNSASNLPRERLRIRESPPLIERGEHSHKADYQPEQSHSLRHDFRRLGRSHDDPPNVQGFQNPFKLQNPQPEITLATRRSVHRSQVLADPIRVPAPIDTRAMAPSPVINSQDDYQSSVPQSDSAMPVSDFSEGHEGNWLKVRVALKPAKSPRKWNFLQRAQASPRKAQHLAAPRSDDDQGAVRELPAAVSRLPESRPIPYYAILNSSEQEDLDTFAAGSTEQYGSRPAVADRQGSPEKQDYRPSMLLPSPPTLTGEFPDVSEFPLEKSPHAPPEVEVPVLDTPVPTEPRRPRLQQIGRIPRVVSKRDRLHKPPPQSFSRPRPYAVAAATSDEAPSSAPARSTGDGFETAYRPVLGIQTEMIPSDPWGYQNSAKPASAPVGNVGQSSRSNNNDEFLAFPPRVPSEVSGSSSSGVASFAATTAVVPEPGTAPDEDEVWNEYNEFLDTVESPAPLANEKMNQYDKSVQKGKWTPSPLQIRKDSSGGPEEGPAANYPPLTPPTRELPSPPKKSKFLDRPSSPGTISDLLAGYGDRNRLSGHTQRKSASSSSRYSTSSIESEADSLAGRENTAKHGAVVVPEDVRIEALMAGTWLSFNHVLFSPADGELRSKMKNRILVLDGLGIDDWAFYCAGNYEDALLSNLSPVQQRPKTRDNYDHFPYTSLDGAFPFPQGYFSAAVFRFPAAASEVSYRHAISEFKRVLRPGGYLELSMLDIDMVNMGDQTRRALRGLKQRKQVAEPNTSLKPLSDNIQKMLGQEAFENLNRCVVDVPVSGRIPISRTGSFDGNKGDAPSVTSSKGGDHGIPWDLAKVGRWWYSRCYEVGPGAVQRSIWDDKALLDECEARKTGFKLFLCYAQKPAK